MFQYHKPLLLLAAPLLLSTAALAQRPIFTGYDFVAGLNPSATTLADVNGDGKPDLLIANKGYNSISVRLGNGMGGFTGSTEVPVGQGPVSVSTGDINKDGFVDLATANSGDHTASYAFGDGTGNFQVAPPISEMWTRNVNTVLLRDMNNDGFPELLLSSAGSNIVYVRDSFGTGKYYNFNYSSYGTLSPLNHFTVADVTNDGLPDLISTGNGVFSVVRQAPGGGSYRAFSVGATGRLSSVAVADVNHDGMQDLIGANQAEKTVTVRFGYSTSGTSYYPVIDVPVGGSPTSIAVGDVNGDGHLDLLSANEDAHSVSVRLGDGTGAFTDGGEVKAMGAYSIILADVNGDNRLDFVTANRSTNSISVRLNTVPPRNLKLTLNDQYSYNQGVTGLSWKPGNATNYVVFAREVRPGRAPLALPVDGVTYGTGRNTQELTAPNLVEGSTYYINKGTVSDPSDTVVFIRNQSIGHVYEAVVYEYTVDPVQGPIYRTQNPSYLTYTTSRLAPTLRASLGANNMPSLGWTTPAQYKSTSLLLQHSVDGVTFTDLSAPVAGLDSASRPISSSFTTHPITRLTYYRVQLNNADGTTLYSNVAQLAPKPLPVQLTSFTGSVKADGTALLTWATATELSSDYFEVERSEDGSRFTSIGKVQAAGTTSQAQRYQLPDSRPIHTSAYYRLHQVDKDGSAQYSSVLVLTAPTQAISAVLFPNPASTADKVTLRLASGKASSSPVRLRIRAAASNQLLTDQLLTPINNEVQWTVASYPAGLYLVEVQSESNRVYTRLLVK